MERTSRAGRLPAAVVLLGFTSFLTDVGSEMIFPLLPVFVASLGANATFLGLVEGVADATSSLLKLASGYASDRFARRKPLVVAGYFMAAAARPLVAFATAPWHVLSVRVVDRFGKGIRSSPRDALIAAAAKEGQAGRAFGFHRAMDHAGAVVGPLVATGLLALGWPLRTVFLAAIVPGLLSTLAAAVVREPPRPPPVPVGDIGRPPPESLSRPLRSYLGIVALFSIGNASDAFLLLRAHEVGASDASLPLIWTVFHVAKVGSAYVAGDLSDRVARPALIVSGWLIYAATYFAFALATRPWHVAALFVVYGVYYGLTEPAERALVKDLAHADARGRAYGAYNFIVGASAIPAGLLTGWLWQTFGPTVALATGSLAALLASGTMMVWMRRRAREVGAAPRAAIG